MDVLLQVTHALRAEPGASSARRPLTLRPQFELRLRLQFQLRLRLWLQFELRRQLKLQSLVCSLKGWLMMLQLYYLL